MTKPEDPSLDAAYALESPEDNKALYREWATDYDADFAAATGYLIPRHVAHALPAAAEGPVLDVGAGTGLVARELRQTRSDLEIHGVDISPEMLAQAQAKSLYDETFAADLTQAPELGDVLYGSVLSAGTFTHGHLGPEVLPTLLGFARQGAHFVLSINAAHFESNGFSSALARLTPKITSLKLSEVPIYDANGPSEHAKDTAFLAMFQKQ